MTLSAAATVQLGVPVANAATCNGPRWIEGVYKLPATAPVVSIASATFVASNGVFGKDPCPNVVKELDVLETASAQTVTVNGKPVPVPALAPVPAPANTIKTWTTTCTVPLTYTQTTTAAGVATSAASGTWTCAAVTQQ